MDPEILAKNLDIIAQKVNELATDQASQNDIVRLFVVRNVAQSAQIKAMIDLLIELLAQSGMRKGDAEELFRRSLAQHVAVAQRNSATELAALDKKHQEPQGGSPPHQN